MKKLIVLFLLSFTFVFANVGKITAVKGDVSVLRDTKSIAAKSGLILELKDKIVTKDKSKALVLFNDNTSITVGKDSVLSVNEFVMDLKTPSNSKTNFGFGKGVFRTITGKIGKINPKGFKIKTKSASIGIRGTTLDTSVRVLPDGSEQVSVAFLKGRGMITNNATGVTTPVDTGQKASVAPGVETKAEEGKLDSSSDLDQDSGELGQGKQDNGNDGGNKKDDGKTDDKGNPNTPPEKEPVISDPKPPELPPVPDPVIKTQNTKPTLTVSSTTLEIDQDTTSRTLKYVADDLEDVLSDLTLEATASNGTVTLSSDGTITYTPNEGHYGSDTITITVTDSEGLSVSETISVTILKIIEKISEATLISDLSSFSPTGEIVDLTSATKETVCPSNAGCDYYTTYLDYGFLTSGGEDVGTYVNGVVTSTDIMKNYIDTAQTARYIGGIAGFDSQGARLTGGDIDLTINFNQAATTALSGTLRVTSSNSGTWNADINNGTISVGGFNATSITGSSGSADIDSGSSSLSGKFYGSTGPDAIGGNFSLSDTEENSVNGVFGAKKQ